MKVNYVGKKKFTILKSDISSNLVLTVAFGVGNSLLKEACGDEVNGGEAGRSRILLSMQDYPSCG